MFSNHRLCDFSYSRSLSCGASHIPKPETGVPHKAWGRRSHNRHCLSCSFGAEGPGRLEPDEQWLSNQMIIKWNYYKMRSGVVMSNPPFSILSLNIMLPHNHIVGLIKQLLWAKCVKEKPHPVMMMTMMNTEMKIIWWLWWWFWWPGLPQCNEQLSAPPWSWSANMGMVKNLGKVVRMMTKSKKKENSIDD